MDEITAIPELLKILGLRGCIATIDAMGCQKAIAGGIVARKADYALPVKANRERLFEAIQGGFAAWDAEPSAFPHFKDGVAGGWAWAAGIQAYDGL